MKMPPRTYRNHRSVTKRTDASGRAAFEYVVTRTQFSLGTNRISPAPADRDHDVVANADMTRERTMSPKNYEAEIAAFIRTKGVTRCPTACAAPTHAYGSATDREALRQRAERLEALREERARHSWARATGVAA
jgi:hypothetical protein